MRPDIISNDWQLSIATYKLDFECVDSHGSLEMAVYEPYVN
jgi:hypothetical protein